MAWAKVRVQNQIDSKWLLITEEELSSNVFIQGFLIR